MAILLLIVGGLIGLAIGIVLSLVAVAVLAVTVSAIVAILLSIFAPVLNLLTPLLALTAGSFIVIAASTIILIYVFAYTLATIDLLPVLPATAPGVPTRLQALPSPPRLLEAFMRGLMIGLTAGMNFGVWSLIPVPFGVFIGLYVGLVCFLAVIPFISVTAVYRGVLGWSSWLMPMSYLATGPGFLLFIINLPFALAAAPAGGPGPVRLDVLTGTIETTGGAVIGITGFGGGFNLGNFTFLTPGPPAAMQGPFGAANLSTHETGHTLNVGAFSGVFTWINAIDENPPILRGPLAYGELTAESYPQRDIFVTTWG